MILTATASIVAVVVMGAIVWKVVDASHLAFSKFGVAFLWGMVWDANKNVFGALPGLYGTAVTSLIALIAWSLLRVDRGEGRPARSRRTGRRRAELV